MGIAIGNQLGSHRITALLGKGGMGEVWRAHDQKLGRDVAIKALPEEFASSPDRLTRFEREARLLAALNHTNIAGIYGLEEHAGTRFLVLELVEGDTLADRIQRGPMGVAEVLKIALQITEALEAAHKKGIVHRDLKPSNIKTTTDGKVKVLDFGLAKMLERSAAVSSMPTQLTASSAGTIAGTPAYMAPEQAKGMEADGAADIWALGCVLYELLAGRRVFQGTTATEILAEVLKSEPDWTRLPAEVPRQLQQVLRRCLQKDVRSRYHHIADVRIALEDLQSDTPASGEHKTRTARAQWYERIVWFALLSVVTGLIWNLRTPTPPARLTLEIAAPPEADAGSIAISPDGKRLVYSALSGGVSRLWVRLLESNVLRALPGTDGATLPFWKPDGQSIGFFAESKLKRMEIDTLAVQTLADATLTPSGGTWNGDGIILFSPGIRGGILKVSDSVGDATPLVPDGVGPKFLADGRRFLYRVVGDPGHSGIYAGSLDGMERRQILDASSVYPALGALFYVRQGRLLNQEFDSGKLALTGNPTVVAESVAVSSDGGTASVAVSDTGVIVYRSLSAPRRLARFDRSSGLETETDTLRDVGGFSPTVSGDGRFVAVSRFLEGRANVWVLETGIGTGTFAPFTTDTSGSQTPQFCGRDVVFSTSRTGNISLFRKSIDGGEDQPLLTTPNAKVATDCSRDGTLILYRENNPETSFDILAVKRSDLQTPIPVLRTPAGERDAQFSHDMKWIAYESNRFGLSQIFIYPFPGPGREQMVSRHGGAQVRWSRDGTELFYIALDGHMMRVPIQFASDGTVNPGEAEQLFMTRVGGVVQSAHKQQYVVSDDGQKFLMSIVVEDALSPITLILNWTPPGK